MSVLNTFIVTFNCAREKVKPEVFARHLLHALPNSAAADVFILSLQEIAPIAYSFLGGSYLTPYLDAFRHAVDIAALPMLNGRCTNIFTRNIGMTVIMAFVPNDRVSHIKWMETAGVGVGLHQMGNKGAVGLRLGYSHGEEVVEVTAVAAHLAPMEDGLDRRNEDWKNIVRGFVFTPVKKYVDRTAKRTREPVRNSDEDESLLSRDPDDATFSRSGLYTPTSHLILAGDLNYRTSWSKPSSTDYRLYPQPTGDVTDPRHYSNLMRKDQLSGELKAGRTCHGLKEAAIDFAPTYKYSNKHQAVTETNDGSTWKWAKHRFPSWCDRILYLDIPSWMKEENPSVSIRMNGYTSLPLMATSDHRPVVLSLSLPAKAIPTPTKGAADGDVRIDPPFAIDPQWMQHRVLARRKEIVVGLLAFLVLTWEGRMVLLAIILGAFSGWFIIGSMLET